MYLKLDGKDLLIINSTVISGILILLTISSFSPGEFPNRSMFVTIAVMIVIMYSTSSIYALQDKLERAKKFAKIGFFSIVGFMIFIGVTNIVNIIAPNIWKQQPILSKFASNNMSKVTYSYGHEKIFSLNTIPNDK